MKPPSWLVGLSELSWRALVSVAALACVFLAISRLRLLAIPIILALFLSALLTPLANRLKQRGLNRTVATSIVFIVVFGVITTLIVALSPGVGRELNEMGEVLREGLDDVESWLITGPLNLSRDQVEGFRADLTSGVRENASPIARGVLEGAIGAVGVATGLLLTIVLTFFFVSDGARMARTSLSIFSPTVRGHVSEMATRAWATLGNYLRGVALIATFDAIAIAIGLTILGVPLVFPLALLVFFGAFIPFVGAFSAGTIAALVALVTEGGTKALLVVVLITAIQQVEGHVLTPVVLARATRLHPVIVILALGAGALLGGVIGALVSVPLAAAIGSVVDYLRSMNPGLPALDTAEETT